MLENLNTRTTADGEEAHAEALHIVRAGLLRAEIGTVTAIFDQWDRRGNRASLGHVVEELKDSKVRGLLASQRRRAIPGKFDELQRGYAAVRASRLLSHVRDVRHTAVAHILRTRGRGVRHQDDIFKLADEAERLVGLLFEGLGRDADFITYRDKMRDRALLFWDTYFAGMRGTTTKRKRSTRGHNSGSPGGSG
jgi:hypothetical protein